MKEKTNKHYVSPADQFLAEFNRNHTNSPSQQAEIDKHKRIFEQRDDATAQEDTPNDKLWD